MKKLDRKRFGVKSLVIAIFVISGFSNNASAKTLNSVSHIHHVKAVENKVFILTHEGLFELVGKNEMKLVGKDNFDVMGFTALGKEYVASGHPAQGSKMPNPIGLVKSTDGGLSWKAISLVGKVDFHFLEGSGSELYGADSQSGNLMYSNDSGKTWSTLGANSFTDIAVSPDVPGMAVAIKESELFLTKNAFKSSVKIKNNLKITQVEWRDSGLYALSGRSLYKSMNKGKTWVKLSKFKGMPGILSASDKLILVTVGSKIYTSSTSGRKFKIFS